ncbi:hypothetical protein ACVNF4_22810 [Streptomyces sp. S6]
MTTTESGREDGRERGDLAGLAGELSAERVAGLPRSAVVEALLRRNRRDPLTPPGWHSAV